MQETMQQWEKRMLSEKVERFVEQCTALLEYYSMDGGYFSASSNKGVKTSAYLLGIEAKEIYKEISKMNYCSEMDKLVAVTKISRALVNAEREEDMHRI